MEKKIRRTRSFTAVVLLGDHRSGRIHLAASTRQGLEDLLMGLVHERRITRLHLEEHFDTIIHEEVTPENLQRILRDAFTHHRGERS